MTRAQQIVSWVEGLSIHEPGRCVPDYSCCRPSLLAARDLRERYADYPESRDILDGLFVSAAIRLTVSEHISRQLAASGVGREAREEK